MQVTLPKVIVLLKDTIEVKERYLAKLKSDTQYYGADLASTATEKFLEVNINELKAILKDLEAVDGGAGHLNLVAITTAAGAPSND